MKNMSLSKIAASVALFAVTAFAILGFYIFNKDLVAMRAARQDDISWHSSQLEVEFVKFTESLALYAALGESGDAGYVNERFDILWSRVAMFRQGPVGERLRSYDDANTIEDLFALMQSNDARVVNIQNLTSEEVLELRYSFFGYIRLVHNLGRDVTIGEELSGAEIRNELEYTAKLTMLLSALAVFGSMLAFVYIFSESRKFKRLAKHNLELAEKAESGSRAKSKFMSMMSHELRTPMNGVLGLLALLKQNGPNASQLRLIEQAEKSANQMVGMLADVLDFSALQTNDIVLNSKPFLIRELATAVADAIAPKSRREGVEIETEVIGASTKPLVGDIARIRQAVVHLAGYIAETAGARDSRISYGYQDGALQVRLTFAYLSGDATWTPDLVVGTPDRGEDKFASDALGPAVARALIDVMQGKIEIHSGANGEISILVRIPLPQDEAVEMTVSIYAQNAAIEAICRAGLRGNDLHIQTERDQSGADIVLVECGGNQEERLLENALRMHPKAMFVALGAPSDPDHFKFIVPMPLNLSTIRETIVYNIAG